MVHRIPTDKEIRDRILAVEDEQTRLAFMYHYLIAGRISEVCGQYAPRGTEAFEVDFITQREIDGKIEETVYPAVLFAVKTAKRKGMLRPVALPLSPEYEPWSQPVLDYFKKAGEDHPFMFHKNWDTSKTYGMNRATKALAGLEWPMIEYTRSALRPVVDDEILDMKIDELGREVYLIEEAGGKRKWFTKAEDGFIKSGVKIPARWKHATSHVFRKRRTNTLKLRYKLNAFGLSAYGGWTEKSQVDAISGAMKHYLYLDIREAEETLGLLMDVADLYFENLLIPYGRSVGFSHRVRRR